MWRPGFEFTERSLATVHGVHRSLCVYSHVHRGTPESPGLVLGLDRGGACRGIAFRVSSARREATIDYLRARELVTNVYKEARLRVRLDDGRRVSAIAYVADRDHSQYAGRLPRDELLRLAIQGRGVSGWNKEYIRNTNEHLEQLGLRDGTLAWISAQLTRCANA